MGDFTDSIAADADPAQVFAYLADVRNLPKYFARMTSAEPGDGEEVHTTARMPDGEQTEGDAWFRTDEQRQRVEWGSEGQSDYHGYVEVRASGSGSEVQVHLHSEHAEPGDAEVAQALGETLAAIKDQVEQG